MPHLHKYSQLASIICRTVSRNGEMEWVQRLCKSMHPWNNFTNWWNFNFYLIVVLCAIRRYLEHIFIRTLLIVEVLFASSVYDRRMHFSLASLKLLFEYTDQEIWTSKFHVLLICTMYIRQVKWKIRIRCDKEMGKVLLFLSKW